MNLSPSRNFVPRYYRCFTCGRKFRTAKGRAVHVALAHNPKPCERCGSPTRRNAKWCEDCAPIVHRRQFRESKRRLRRAEQSPAKA